MSKEKKAVKLNELQATAICGNDISSSCLYVSALAIIYSGQYAWVALLLVAFVLFLYRKIYGEVVGALPLNGGAYNALLNTTSKSMASLAASLTLLSYMATAVISASEAMHYVHHLLESWPVLYATIGLLAVFMILFILGIGESAKVAVGIFLFHLFSLITLSLFCGWYLLTHGFSLLVKNMNLPLEGSLTNALFFGFAAAMLGISGFESSANFVEEQDKGVFRKTLRNMWVVVSVFNPLMAFFALAIIPLGDVGPHQETLLSHLGGVASGNWLSFLISIDAALVLSGAVLTSYVGVGGLIERMTLDRVLPQFLLKKNKRGSSYRIAMSFFFLCISVLLITAGELKALAGVYTIAFLSVMALFGIGNILLKVRRAKLPRPEQVSWPALLLAILAVLVALVGNVTMNPRYFAVFLEYFLPTLLAVSIMLNRTLLLKLVLSIIRYFFKPMEKGVQSINSRILRQINDINSQEFVFFTKDDDIAVLNKVLLYIKQNEHTKRLKVVTIIEEEHPIPTQLKSDIEVLDREYPEIKVDFIELTGTFGPQLIKQLSKEWAIPVNFMFIGSPGNHFPYKIEELGGVRLII